MCVRAGESSVNARDDTGGEPVRAGVDVEKVERVDEEGASFRFEAGIARTSSDDLRECCFRIRSVVQMIKRYVPFRRDREPSGGAFSDSIP